jgi:hypothetical protein
MTRKLFGVLFMTLLAQDVLGGPVRLGPTAGYLTDADALAIGRLFDGTRKPWVMVGHSSGFIRDEWFIDVYLEPDSTTAAIRRGSLEVVVAPLPSDGSYASHGAWNKRSSARYAQVLSGSGNPDVLLSRRDLNRPFRVVGTITDEELATW